jgi:hypothetical protein
MAPKGALSIFNTPRLCILRVTTPDSLLTISAVLFTTAAAMRAFRAVENQALLVILVGKTLWAE